MLFWEILVPTISNDGVPYRTKYHKLWDAKVRDICGGVTIIPPIRGQWVSDDDELFEERMIPVRIACTKEQIEKNSRPCCQTLQPESCVILFGFTRSNN